MWGGGVVWGCGGEASSCIISARILDLQYWQFFLKVPVSFCLSYSVNWICFRFLFNHTGSRRDQEEGGGAGPSSQPRRDHEQGGGVGLRKLDFFRFELFLNSSALVAAQWRGDAALINTSIVLAAVHGLSGLFRAVSAVEPEFTLSSSSAPVPVPNKQPRFCGRKAIWSFSLNTTRRRLCHEAGFYTWLTETISFRPDNSFVSPWQLWGHEGCPHNLCQRNCNRGSTKWDICVSQKRYWLPITLLFASRELCLVHALN